MESGVIESPRCGGCDQVDRKTLALLGAQTIALGFLTGSPTLAATPSPDAPQSHCRQCGGPAGWVICRGCGHPLVLDRFKGNTAHPASIFPSSQAGTRPTALASPQTQVRPMTSGALGA